ncbi:serine hydrolase RBBP9-like [Bradysia coprophila]|uniref:serine hydrolase RBBP9-like n=1 Tax=Bradysia coprophila TaxID=38358 RepID=UPI00187D9503|nr:serine hydrolase RBBP9-like [Bradysia coprophila]
MAETINPPSENQRIVIIPGMGCVPVRESNWYSWLQDKLESDETGRFTVVLEDMPDPHAARESQWLPFIRDTLKFDEKTILIGHSSGCEAIMRLLEKDKVRGIILVAACHTDLGDENERASEYYNRPWDWDTIRSNAEWIVQLHSPSDKCIPEEEGRFVADKLKSEYMKLERRGHFMGPTLPEVLKVIREKCNL